MYYYKLYGSVVGSDIDFVQLIETNERDADIIIEAGNIPEDIIEKEADGKKYEFGAQRSWLCNKTCRFVVENGNHITYYLKPGMNEVYLRTYILGFGVSMLAMQRGEVSMHCSAISKDGRAVLICGEPGAGKSTVTTEFLNMGWSLMADDMAVVEVRDNTAYVKPGFPYQKLCRDAALDQGYNLEELIYIDETKDKFLVKYKGEFGLEEVIVEAVIMLSCHEGEKVEHGRIEGIASFFACSENIFLRKLLGQEKYAPEIGTLCLRLAGAIDAYSISRPVIGNSVPEITRIILEYLD